MGIYDVMVFCEPTNHFRYLCSPCRNSLDRNVRAQKVVGLKDLQREGDIAYCLSRYTPESETLPPKAAVAKLTALGKNCCVALQICL